VATVDRPTAIDLDAPPERLAAFRMIIGAFALGYLLVRLPAFLDLRDRPASSFDGVGVLAAVRSPMPGEVLVAVIGVSIVAGAAFVAGSMYVVSGPAFAIGMLVLTTYRSSWGQLLHFENLMVLYLLVVAFSPAADAWSLRRRGRPRPARRRGAYGWPLALAAMILVATYVITGVAKLRYGGLEWITSDSLRNHVAYSSARLDLLGEGRPPLARLLVPHRWIFPPLAATTVAIELMAPAVLVWPLVRTPWVIATWAMHAAIVSLMLVSFPVPLIGVAFAPLYRLERLPGARHRITTFRRPPTTP
jgi:hypothetical protein